MDIRLIHRIEEFDRLRPSWERAFAADRHASVFLSWSWLRGWFEVTPYPWAVLAVRTALDADWVGFLPISIRGGKRYDFHTVRELHMGGDPGADYTGFVCRPDRERTVIDALSNHVAERLKWDRLRFKEINDPRIDWFLARLNRPGITIERHQGTCCPSIQLPASWEAYEEQCLGYGSRKSLRKKLRLAERELQVTHLTPENRDQQIADLMKVALARTRESLDPNIHRCPTLLRWCADAGLASIIILRKDETPIAGMGSFMDRKAGSMCFYVTGFDERFSQYSPGRVVNAICIRHAIEQGCKVVDFLRGEEPYKYQFGAQKRNTGFIIALRKGLGSAVRCNVQRLRAKLAA